MSHEFGHFGQRNSSFLTRFITRTNSWFVVAVSERDLLDAFIETLSEAGHYLATLVAFLLLVLARLGRYVLLALTWDSSPALRCCDEWSSTQMAMKSL